MVGLNPARVAPWLLLGGCWVTAPEIDAAIEGDADTDADTDAGGDLDVLSVDPPYGSTGGGAIVTINTGALGSDVSVRFGDAEATVVSAGGDEVVVELPAQGDDGLVDVVVTSGGASGTLRDAFTYWEDGQGLVGAIGEIASWDYRGGYWAEDYDYAEGSLRLIRPTDLRHADLWGGETLDRCVTNAGAVDYPDAYGLSTRLSLVSDGAAIDLTRSGDLYAGDVGDADWIEGASYALELDAPGFPAEIQGFLTSPSPLQLDAPYIEGATPAEIDLVGSSFSLEWAGPYDGDYVVASLYRQEGEDLVDEVRCTLTDDGQFTVPSTVWTDWYSDERLTLYVGRVALPSAILPTSGGRVEVAGVRYAVGVVYSL